jgi:hypothetical protein
MPQYQPISTTHLSNTASRSKVLDRALALVAALLVAAIVFVARY